VSAGSERVSIKMGRSGASMYVPNMSALSNFVSLHPYFKVHPGKLDAIKAMLPQFTARSDGEGDAFVRIQLERR